MLPRSEHIKFLKANPPGIGTKKKTDIFYQHAFNLTLAKKKKFTFLGMLFAFPFPNLLLDIKLEFSNTHMYLFSAYSMLLSYYSGKEKRL